MLIFLLPFPPSNLKNMLYKFKTKNEELTKLQKVCETPEQVKMLLNYGVRDFLIMFVRLLKIFQKLQLQIV